MAFRRKKDAIVERNPDLLVIQECENPAETGEWDEFEDWKWIGENKHKGLSVFTRSGITIQTATELRDSRYALLVETTELDLLAIWAMNDKQNPSQRYIGQVYTALSNHSELLDTPLSVLGDFNWNVKWDQSPNSPLCGDFSDTVDLLNESNLQSVYHQLTGEEFGAEISPTFYMHKKHSRPYHIDYAFLPDQMLASAEVSVGEYDEWIDASDHMPLIINV